MRKVLTLTRLDACAIVESVIEQAKATNEFGPIAVGVCDHAGRLLAFEAMDGAKPIAAQLALDKAYTAIMMQRHTIFYQRTGLDPSNFRDPHITFLAGGRVVECLGWIVGSVGVSGRKAYSEPDVDEIHDDELAAHGIRSFFSSQLGTSH